MIDIENLKRNGKDLGNWELGGYCWEVGIEVWNWEFGNGKSLIWKVGCYVFYMQILIWFRTWQSYYFSVHEISSDLEIRNFGKNWINAWIFLFLFNKMWEWCFRVNCFILCNYYTKPVCKCYLHISLHSISYALSCSPYHF